jgi:hypothetical protein
MRIIRCGSTVVGADISTGCSEAIRNENTTIAGRTFMTAVHLVVSVRALIRSRPSSLNKLVGDMRW